MIAPSALLRDTALTGAALVLLAALTTGGRELLAVAAGAGASIFNLWLAILAAREVVHHGWVAPRLALKTLAALCMVLALVSVLPALPVVVGFFAFPLALVVRALRGRRAWTVS
jgi:hypothetical protein